MMRASTYQARFLASILLSQISALMAVAENVVYVTDLSIYTYLAPCAASAISQNIAIQTYSSNCPEGVTELQSCICTENFDVVASGMSATVSASCGSTATDDQASASSVLGAYCNQPSTVAFPTPTHLVSSYIAEITAISDLAPCASKALSQVVQYNTYFYCPPDPTALAPCVCEKNQNSLRVSASINREVGSVCSSNTADMSSANALFSAYCAMNSGTTSFPTATDPPGDMTYYVTDLPQYSSLASCAQRGVSSAVFYQTWDVCRGSGPQALASCACIKPSVSRFVSSWLTSNVRFWCTADYMDNMASASSVMDFYCSAAGAEVTATGIVPHVSQTSTATTRSSSRVPSSTSSPGGSGGSHGPSNGAIAGAIVGGVIGLFIACAIVFFLWRRGRKQQRERDTNAHNIRPAGDSGAASSKKTPATAAALPVLSSSDQAVAGDDNSMPTPIAGSSSAAPPPYEPGTYGDMYRGKPH